MSVSSNYFHLNQGEIEYITFGTGKELLICIHGFGDRAQLYEVLPSLGIKYTVYAFSLPFHGDTQWKKKKYSIDDIRNIIDLIREQSGKERFSLMGYSMGGKIVLGNIEHYAHFLDQVYLCASDGIKTHIFFDVSNLPYWFVKTVKILMRAPRIMFKIVDWVYKRGIFTKFLYDFTYNHFKTTKQRRRFFGTSESSRKISPNLEQVQTVLNTFNIPVEMFFGVRDEVIFMSGAKRFAAGIEQCNFYELDKGHLLIDEDLNSLLEEKVLISEK